MFGASQHNYIYIRKFGVKSLFKAYFIKINTIFRLNNAFVNFLYFPNIIFKSVTIKRKLTNALFNLKMVFILMKYIYIKQC